MKREIARMDKEALRKEIQEQLVKELRDKLRKELAADLRSELMTEIRAELKTELREEVHKELRRELQEEAAGTDQHAESEQDAAISKSDNLLHFMQGGTKLHMVPQDSSRLRKEKVKAVGMGFWENVDDYLEPDYIEDQPFSIPKAFRNTSIPQGTGFFFENLPPAMEEAAAAAEAAPAVQKQRVQPRTEPSKRQEERPEQAETPKGETAPGPSSGKSKQSPAITEEIRMIRQKYIVGKIAGEDVYGGSGKLIIAKQSVITGEDVDKADAEGKLAELIVNMIIPGLGED
jgi:hypothetical protein